MAKLYGNMSKDMNGLERVGEAFDGINAIMIYLLPETLRHCLKVRLLTNILGTQKAGQAAGRVNRPRQGRRGSSLQGGIHGVFTIRQPVPTGHFVNKLTLRHCLMVRLAHYFGRAG